MSNLTTQQVQQAQAESLVKPEVIPMETNYKVSKEYTPRYRFTRTSSTNLTGDQVTLKGGQVQPVRFRIPAGTYNLAKTEFTAEVSIPAQGTFTPEEGDAIPYRSFMFADVFCLANRVTFAPSSGLPLADLEYANNYTKIANKIGTKMEDYLENDITYPLHKSNEVPDNNPRAEDVNSIGNQYGLDEEEFYTGGVTDTIEPKHLFVSDIFVEEGQPSLPLPQTRGLHVPLSIYKDTILALDKDIYWPVEMILTFYIGPVNKIAFRGTEQYDPFVNADSLDPSKDVTISKMYLYVANEINKVIVDSLMNKINTSGLRLQIPHTQGFLASTSGNVSNVNLQLNSAYGKTLKYITDTVWNIEESDNYAYDCTNVNGQKIKHYMTYINSVPQFDDNIYCYQPGSANLAGTVSVGNSDWMHNKKHCKGAVIMNAFDYQLNWFHRDAFANHNLDSMQNNIEAGLDMTLPQNRNLTWAFNSQSNGAVVHYIYATFLKDVIISANGVQWEEPLPVRG